MCLWNIQQDDVRAIAGQGLGDGCANPSGGTGHQGAAAGQRAGPVLDVVGARAQAQNLAADEGTAGRQEEAQGAFELVFGGLVDIQQLHGGTVAQFLAQ